MTVLTRQIDFLSNHGSLPFLPLKGTFKEMTWFGKPKELSPVECARHGWVNTLSDTLACETCKALILCRLDHDLDESTVAIQRYTEALTDSHKDTCSWKNHAVSGTC